MNKPIIIYKSATGFTKKYAELLAANLGCEAVSLKEVSAGQLSGYDTLIFGSRIHAGRIDSLDKARKLFSANVSAKRIIFVTGGTPSEATEIIDKLWADNLTAQEQYEVAHFYMPGGLCYEKMSVPDRMLMKMAAKMMEKGEHTDPVEAGFANAIAASYDISDEKYIKPLLDYIKAAD